MSQVIVKEKKWHDKALIFRSALIGLIFFGVLLVMGERAKPPEGYVFERLPPVSGIYQCCGSGGRTSMSWVGTVAADCASMEYFPFTGVNWHDCGYKKELNGQMVEIERTTVPTLFSNDISPVVIKLSSGGKTYIEYSNEKFRNRWIARMRSGALLIAFIIAVLFHTIQLIQSNKKSRKTQETQL